ncbi:MAG: hypothetical protein HYV93_13850 [Candidatus Rokubacteria bacterium]|nr:hypothetical protein [Candidatus Rokubacteria bacterium]
MRHSALRRIALGAALVFGLWPAPVEPLPRSPALIRQQLETSLQQQLQALSALDEPDRAQKLTWEAYVQMRAAHGNMIINASNTKFPDPLFPLADRRIEQARAQILSAHDALKSRKTWNASSNPIDVARKHLTEAVRLTRIIVATTF